MALSRRIRAYELPVGAWIRVVYAKSAKGCGLRPLVKKAFPLVARLIGLSNVTALRYRGRGAIFAMHSVVDDTAFHPDETLRCPANKLEATLRWLKRRGVEFVSLDAAMRRLGTPADASFAVFTFDDGYADNLTRVLQIMERFGAPFTVYVTTGMITRTIDAWWFGLSALIRAHEQVEIPGLAPAKPVDAARKTGRYVRRRER